MAYHIKMRTNKKIQHLHHHKIISYQLYCKINNWICHQLIRNSFLLNLQHRKALYQNNYHYHNHLHLHNKQNRNIYNRAQTRTMINKLRLFGRLKQMMKKNKRLRNNYPRVNKMYRSQNNYKLIYKRTRTRLMKVFQCNLLNNTLSI